MISIDIILMHRTIGSDLDETTQEPEALLT